MPFPPSRRKRGMPFSGVTLVRSFHHFRAMIAKIIITT
jgi:hypothetical protein